MRWSLAVLLWLGLSTRQVAVTLNVLQTGAAGQAARGVAGELQPSGTRPGEASAGEIPPSAPPNPTPSTVSGLIATLAAPQKVAALQRAQVACPQVAHCFGVRFWVHAADGVAVANDAWLISSVAFANRMFAPVDAGFTIVEVRTATFAAQINSRKLRTAVVTSSPASKWIDVMVVPSLFDLDTPNFPLWGVHWRATAKRRGILLNASAAWDRTLAHELGHYFGLPHSSYAISIMNKTLRTTPWADRRFADAEQEILRKNTQQPTVRKQSSDH